MPTVKQLRQQAKARKVPKYSSMNKASLLSALGMSNEAKAQKSQSTKRKAIEVHSRTLSEGNATKRAQIKGRITRAVKRELDAAKKSGKELSQDEKRAIATKALAREVKAIKAGKSEKQKPFGIQKPPHMSVAEYREHLRRKFDPNSSGSRVEAIAKKEKKRSEIGSGEFEGRSTAANLRQMEQQGKVNYPTDGLAKPRVKRQELTYQAKGDGERSGFPPQKLTVSSYVEVGNHKVVKVHRNLHEVLDANNKVIRQATTRDYAIEHAQELQANGAKARSQSPSSPRLIEKTVDGRKRTFNRSGSEVVRGRSID